MKTVIWKPRAKNAWSIIRALWYGWLADERPLNTLHYICLLADYMMSPFARSPCNEWAQWGRIRIAMVTAHISLPDCITSCVTRQIVQLTMPVMWQRHDDTLMLFRTKHLFRCDRPIATSFDRATQKAMRCEWPIKRQFADAFLETEFSCEFRRGRKAYRHSFQMLHAQRS